jgi:hypothetical protein
MVIVRSKKKKKSTPRASSSASASAAAAAAAQDKSSKGLRHFSMKVCKKVEEKGRTNYNEVRPPPFTKPFSPEWNPP